jgi:uroporphyrinogen decarboxylase
VGPVNDRLIRALRREPVDRTPVWFMRQAGRYLPEYRELRGDRDILDAVRSPAEAVEITLQPLRRMPLDAAILFSDIVVPLVGIGFDFRIEAGRGPVLDDPVRSARDLDRFRPLEPEVDEPFTLEAVRLLTKELEVPLIGFAGAPFTLASYLIEGRPSRTHDQTKAMMFDPFSPWFALADALADLSASYLRAQVDAGAEALQVFDSWAGALSRADYERYVRPSMTRLFDSIADLDVPVIHFGVGTAEFLPSMRHDAVDVVGVDWRLPLDEAWSRLEDGTGNGVGIQGNLDPTACLAPWPVVEERARAVLSAAGGRDGHVFNLGHGVLPETDPATLERLVDLVHTETER